MRKIYVLGMALLMAAVMALPANAAMWVGGELGGNIIGDTNLTLSSPQLHGQFKFTGVHFEPTVIGGLTVGYDFVNAGFAGYAWPDWMKYFGFIMDFTYNRVTIKQQTVPTSFGGTSLGNLRLFAAPLAGTFKSESNGCIPVLAFLLYGHYGFFPDSEIAIGRVHPYIGVGPAIAFANLDAGPWGLGNKYSTNIALAAEAGVRFILLPNVTTDLGFRYRYLQPSWTFSSPPAYLGSVKASVDAINSFSFLWRVNYHF